MADTTPQSGGNLFTRKIGPLPMWGWVAGVGGLVVVWAIYERKKTASTTTSTSATSGTATTSGATAPLQPPVIYQNYNTNLNPISTPVQTTPPVQTPPPPSTSTPPPATTSSAAPNVVGLPLAEAIQQLTAAGWILNSVGNSAGQGVNQQSQASSPVTGQQAHTTGMAGQYFAHSVSLTVQ